MEPLQQRLRLILQWSIVTVACSILIGLIFYQGAVFNIHSHTFVFVADAALGALFFFTLRFAGWRDALVALAVLYLLYLGPLTHAFQYGYTLTYSIFFATTPLAVLVYFISFYEPRRVAVLWHPLLVGGLCAGTMILARILIVAIGKEPWYGSWLEFPRAVFSEDWMALLQGVGMGTGFALSAYRPFRRFLGLPA